MADDELIHEDDVRAIVRLLGDVAAIDGDQVFKRRALMEGIAGLVGADVWMWVVSQWPKQSAAWVSISIMHGGMTEKEFALITESHMDPDRPMAEQEGLDRMVVLDRQRTSLRRALVPDEDWYGDPNVLRYREGFIDDAIYSILGMSGEPLVISGLGFHRRWGRERYTPREARIVHIITSEVRWLHVAAVPDRRGDNARELPPRLRRVLVYLVDGWTQKKIAHRVGLSPHTVNGYTKEIYKHFGVGSRVELLRRFMTGDGGDAA